jgi:D-alanyl-lipoteichoic acid acyltransferase DltB (MBOAT superfamily)
MLWGLFKKAVVADRLALFVDQVYNNVYDYQGWPLIVATVFFAFQIYCDFSGYSDIAIGAAQVFGIRLMDNFNRPYFAKSVSEFWKRWHISLTSWFKDYVYIPLGGNRVSPLRWYLNIFIVFLISGLWHGANWTFAVWGALNGMYLLMSIWTKKWRCQCVKVFRLRDHPGVHKYVKVAVTFSLICFSWIFFRANNISEAGYIVTHLLRGLSDPHMGASLLNGFGLGFKSLLVAVAATLFMETVHLVQRHQGIRQMLAGQPAVLRLTVYTVMVMGILLFGNFHAQPFIYFQF